MLDRLKALWHTEPARVIAFLTAVAAFVAAEFGIVIDEQAIGEAIALAGLILLGGEGIRSQVSPAAPADIPASDELLVERLERSGVGEPPV